MGCEQLCGVTGRGKLLKNYKEVFCDFDGVFSYILGLGLDVLEFVSSVHFSG